MKLKEKLLEAKANDSYVYKATWQKLSSDNISGAEDVLRMIGSLKNMVEKHLSLVLIRALIFVMFKVYEQLLKQ